MAARLHTAPDEADRNTVRASELLHGNRRHRGRAVRRVPCRHQGRPGPGRPSATLKFDLRAARRSCVTPVGSIEGNEVTTLEGLGTLDNPHPLQKAFIDEQAAQCGYCASGMIM